MILIIGSLQSIVECARDMGLTGDEYVPVYLRRANDALRGCAGQDGLTIVYVAGADIVLDQPGIRTYIGACVGLGASELVASA